MRKMKFFLIFLMFASQAANAKPENMKFILHRTVSENLDLGKTGPSMGDIHVNQGDLLDIRTKAKIGTYTARLIMVSSEQNEAITADLSL